MKNHGKIFNLVLFLLIVFLLTACGKAADTNKNIKEPVKAEQKDKEKEREDLIADAREAVDLSLKPNETGKIMVLMYHGIGEEEKEWVRTPENFRKDLEILYKKGYRPVSLTDFVKGNITVEAGCSPVVITFDDGLLNNFEYLEDGKISPQCAVGILIAFHEKYPDFPLEATFFLNNQNPFRQSELITKKLDYLLSLGMDIGNHTFDHENLRDEENQNAIAIQKAIGAQVKYLQGKISDKDYQVNTLALPYGGRPKNENLNQYLASGVYEGIKYQNLAVLNVGWQPACSPYDVDFDPIDLPRIRASETKVDNVGLYNYLDSFDKHPENRFISDGNPQLVTVPAGRESNIEKTKLAGKEIYIYTPTE